MTTEVAAAPKTEKASSEGELKLLLLEHVRESRTNPRRTFNPKGMAELIASVKEKGVINPILARRMGDDRFEIVAGARRYRASKEAGLKTIPAIVRELTDEQALEAQVIENLQREDVHPLEEAEGYQALIEKAKYDAEILAEKVSKSLSYIYQRLKLVELIEPVKKIFVANEITPAHAVMIARLTHDDQTALLKGGLFERVWDRHSGIETTRVISVKQLALFIAKQIHRSLAAAPWKKEDADLLPKAGPCTTCPYRAGNQPELFSDVPKSGEVCTRPVCYEAKLMAFAERRFQEIKKVEKKAVRISQDWSKAPAGAMKRSSYSELNSKQKNCPNTTRGVYIDGNEIGKDIRICTKEGSCKVHNAHHYSGGSNDNARKREREAAKKKQRQAEINRRITALLLPKVVTLDEADLRMIADSFFADVWYERRKKIANRNGWPDSYQHSKQINKLGTPELVKLILEIAITGRDGDLYAAARRHGVDPKKIETAYKAEIAAKQKAKKKPVQKKK